MQKFLKSYDGLLFFATLAMFCRFLAIVEGNYADFQLFSLVESLRYKQTTLLLRQIVSVSALVTATQLYLSFARYSMCVKLEGYYRNVLWYVLDF